MENNFYYVHLSHRLHIHYMQKYHCVHNALCANKHFLLNKQKQKQNKKGLLIGCNTPVATEF